MTFGESRRTKPRINVLRGYGGNETNVLTKDAVPKALEAILSGMIISLDTNGQWIKGCPQGSIPFWAFHDQSDPDVDSSGKLLGLSGLGDYEIETGHFKTSDTYTQGLPVVNDAGVAGTIKVGNAAINAETAIEDVVGFVTAGKRQVQAGTITKAGITGIYDPAQNVNSQATLGAISTLTFVTRWMPARKAVGMTVP